MGPDFGKKDLLLPPNSYENIALKLEEKLREMLQYLKHIPTERYDDKREILGGQYVINLRNQNDKSIYYLNLIYLNLKSYYDNGYPLYLSIATP